MAASIILGLGLVGSLHGGEPDQTVAELMVRAGNVDGDGDRLVLLRELRELPNLDRSVQADADQLIAEIEKWLYAEQLPYFFSEVAETLDYDFGLEEDSPLYPLTCLYRGRMLVWSALESGTIWMRDNGEYGGGWGDDCEMWRWWVPVLIGFDNPGITSAQARFSEALMGLPHMEGGYTRHLYDVEHTAEDSSDAITPMMHLDPDNPVWRDRALRLAELMDSLWTGINERGFLQFKSTYVCVDRVEPNPQRACDTVYHPRAVQPALLYWQRTGDERLGQLFAAWMDTWVDAALRAERGKPSGIIPSAIHWPDGQVGGLGENWWDPRNHGEATLYQWPSALPIMASTLLLTHHMTRDRKYLEPIRSMAKIRLDYLRDLPDETSVPGTELWCAQHLGLLTGVVAKYRVLTGLEEFDELLGEERDPYMALRMRGDRDMLTLALRDIARALRFNFAGYTTEVRFTDRVLRFPALFQKDGMFPEGIETFCIPDTTLLYSSVTGDPGDLGYFPMNAVRWLTPSRQIAVLVADSTPASFHAELFHFGENPRPMSAEFYLLAPGEYRFQITGETGPLNGSLQELRVTSSRTRVQFELAPRTLCRLQIDR